MLDSPQLRPSKFSPRPLGPNHIERHRLLTVLQQNSHAKLVLVHAPAGFGKTTLLAQWHQHLGSAGQGTGWITVDDDDNDAGRFAVILSQALLPDAGGVIADLFDSINRSLQTRSGFTLFLDEAEHLTAPDAAHLLEVMLDNSPASLHLVIGSRARPTLLGTRLRVRDDFLELTTTHLAFQSSEIAQFMQVRCGVAPDAEVDDYLARRTEGWAAALQLAAVAIAQGEPAQTVIEHLAAPCSDLFQYLSQEIIIHLPSEQRRFLLETSFLSTLSGPLCDAVTGRTDSNSVLAGFEQAHLLLLPVDRGRSLYRYHPLFADCLHQQFRKTDAGRLPELARRAAEWCSQAQMPESAVEYALLTGDSAYVIACIMKCVERLVMRAQFLTLRRWLDALPPQALEGRADLLAWVAWVHFYMNDFAAAEAALAGIERLGKLQAASPRDRVGNHVLRTFLLISRGRFDEALATIDSVLEQAYEFDRLSTAAVTNMRAMLAQMHGRLGEAVQQAERVIATSAEPPALWLSVVHAALISGLAELALGNLVSARRHLEAPERLIAAKRGSSDLGVDPRQLLVAIASPMALVLYEQNKIDAAEDCLERHAPFLNSTRPTSNRALWHQLRARVAFLQGDEDAHAAAIQEGNAYAIRHGLSWIEATMQWERVAFDIARGDLSHARSIGRGLLADVRLDAAPDWIAPCDEVFGPIIGAIRYLIHTGDGRRALESLQVHIAQSEKQLRRLRLTKLRVLEALGFEALGERARALVSMRVALDLGTKSGAVRTFADEGSSCHALLSELDRTSPGAPNSTPNVYLRGLLTAFDGAQAADPAASAGDPIRAAPAVLSAREVQILQRLAQGHSNLAVGQQLFLSPNTIKWHLGQIYVKLGAKNRTQAVHVARQHNLLPPQQV
jgi:LuxR family transcriptional regulator, maltose regulon positive regulatory protein